MVRKLFDEAVDGVCSNFFWARARLWNLSLVHTSISFTPITLLMESSGSYSSSQKPPFPTVTISRRDAPTNFPYLRTHIY